MGFYKLFRYNVGDNFSGYYGGFNGVLRLLHYPDGVTNRCYLVFNISVYNRCNSFYIRFREQWRLREQIKKQFEHYLDPRQVKRLQQNPDLLKLGGEKEDVLFVYRR